VDGSKQPTWIRILGQFKPAIEQRVGLSLADAVNVAMFLLTLVSLVIAGIGIWVALLAMKEAKAGGDQQQATLDASRKSLEKVVSNLTLLDQTLDSSLSTAREQQKLLQQATDVARDQLAVLSKENQRAEALASRKADVALNVRCGPARKVLHEDPWEGYQYDLEITTSQYTMNGQTVLHGHPKELNAAVVNPDQSGLVFCDFSLRNAGELSLTNAFIKTHVRISTRSHPAPNGAVLTYNLTDPENSPNAPVEDANVVVPNDDFIVLLHNRTIFPNSHHSALVRALLMLKISPGVSELRFDYEFGGDQQAPTGYYDFIEIKSN
jgi:hypothetical protein